MWGSRENWRDAQRPQGRGLDPTVPGDQALHRVPFRARSPPPPAPAAPRTGRVASLGNQRVGDHDPIQTQLASSCGLGSAWRAPSRRRAASHAGAIEIAGAACAGREPVVGERAARLGSQLVLHPFGDSGERGRAAIRGTAPAPRDRAPSPTSRAAAPIASPASRAPERGVEEHPPRHRTLRRDTASDPVRRGDRPDPAGEEPGCGRRRARRAAVRSAGSPRSAEPFEVRPGEHERRGVRRRGSWRAADAA